MYGGIRLIVYDERRHLELGRLRPGLTRVGGAAGLVPRLEHHDALAVLGEVGGGDEAVVATADDDRVVPLSHAYLPGQCQNATD